MPKSKRPTLGPCGEFYVASYFAGMGLTVEFTKPGTKLIDMHVGLKNRKRRISVQIKTGGTTHNHKVYKSPDDTQFNHRIWHVGKKAYGYSNTSHWYAFVSAGDWPRRQTALAPTIYLIPSQVVSRILDENPKNQREWFWIYDNKIGKYGGRAGFASFKRALIS